MGELFQKGVQHLELAVHVDPQCLEGPLAGLLHRLLALGGGEEGQRPLDESVQLPGGVHGAAPAEHLNDGLCDAVRVGLVGIFHQQVLQLLLVQLPQPLRRGDAGGGVQPQVQGTVLLEGKAPGRVVDLHGGDA